MTCKSRPRGVATFLCVRTKDLTKGSTLLKEIAWPAEKGRQPSVRQLHPPIPETISCIGKVFGAWLNWV